MGGLLLKELYCTVKQSRIFVALGVIIALLPVETGTSVGVFGYAIFYASMTVITSLAYEERAQWRRLASMMPYSEKQIVLSKYIFGYICVGIVTLLIMISRACYAMIGIETYLSETIVAVILIACVALSVQAVNLAIMLKIGVEKGRLLFIFLVVIVIVFTMNMSVDFMGGNKIFFLDFSKPVVSLLICAAITAVINVICIFISEKIYR